ncbi:hypothetical protein R6Q59_009970 [Mikania micrantha]
MIRTSSASRGPTPSMYANIEMYSIAFTAQYFWVIFAVIWQSVIGVSQSAAAIPRILHRFRSDLINQDCLAGLSIKLPVDRLDNEDDRTYNGGIYSWQPARYAPMMGRMRKRQHSRKNTRQITESTVKPTSLTTKVVPFLVVAMAAGTGQLISSLVPPEGWTCRSDAMLGMFAAWVGSYFLGLIPCAGKFRLLFWLTFVKDLIIVAITCGLVIWTQFGAFNRCSCYTRNGMVGVQLPFMPAVHDILQSRLSSAYPAVVIVGISVQLVVIPSLLLWQYHAAVQVYLQRDDGKSNFDWLSSMQRSKHEPRYKVLQGVQLSAKVSQAKSVTETPACSRVSPQLLPRAHESSQKGFSEEFVEFI